MIRARGVTTSFTKRIQGRFRHQRRPGCDNWTLYDAVSNIWRAYVGMGRIRGSVCDGVRAIRARGPLNPSGLHITSTGFYNDEHAMQSWGNITNIELVHRNDWKQLRCPNCFHCCKKSRPGWTYVCHTHAWPTIGTAMVSFR